MISSTTTQTHYRTCNLCEAMCGIEITYKDKEIISIKGDKNDVLSHGHICPKAVALKDLYEDKDRLKTPLKKTKNGWKAISWNDAFDEVATKLKAIRKKYGNDAIASYQGNPTVHNVGLMLYGKPFLQSIKSKNKYTATSVDQLPHHIASLLMFGHQMLIPIPDLDSTDFLVIMGANPAVSNGSMLTAPGFSNKIKAIQKRGGTVINIDPRFTETSKISSQHLYITPGKDALFLASIIETLFSEKLIDTSDLFSEITGFDELESLFAEFTPEKTHYQIGISSEEIKQLARNFANAKTAVFYGRFGLSTQKFGGTCQWLINVLNTITGNMDTIGGALFTQPAIDLVMISGMSGKTGTFNRYQSRVHQLPEYSGEFPVATLADEILTDGKDQIKALVCIAGNPVLSVPNGEKMEKALAQLDFMVSIDIYLNETSKYADIILPTTTGLETVQYDLAFHQLAVRNTAKYADPLFEKEKNQQHDWEILNALTERMTGKKNPATPEMMLNFMLKYSPYKNEISSIKDLKNHKHGLDFGALKPCLKHRLFTEDKKIHLVPKIFVDDLDRLKKSLKSSEENDNYPFYLIGRRQLRTNNSWMHNSAILMKGDDRCLLFINTKDAKDLQLTNKQIVTISSSVSNIKIPIKITDNIQQGVLSMPHGFGHHRNGIQLTLAQKKAGVSINDVTDDSKIDALTGNADFSGTRVMILE